MTYLLGGYLHLRLYDFCGIRGVNLTWT